MTQKTNEQLHRELWRWLAETGSASKEDWPGWKDIKKPFALCFACNEAGRFTWNDCGYEEWFVHCPIQWTKNQHCGESPCLLPQSPYKKWENAKTAKTRKKYAAIIAELPWKGGKP